MTGNCAPADAAGGDRPPAAVLHAVVSVDPADRILCQNPGCSRPVYAAIHVVQDAGKLMVLGSDCFARRFGGASTLGAPRHGGGGGRGLTSEERALLLQNTQELLARFDDEARLRAEAARLKTAAARRPVPAASPSWPGQPVWRGQRSGLPPRVPSPWPWQKALTSVAMLTSPEGQRWFRVQHQDGSQKLVPWPKFPGWERALPVIVGAPDRRVEALAVNDIRTALSTLQELGYSMRIGAWHEVAWS